MPDDLSNTHAADVLRRAALLQARSEPSTGMGLSLDELKHAAEAAGIDGRYVEQAYFGAGEDLAPSEPFMGIETGVQRVRVVPGHVSEEEWGQMVLALRREFGTDGSTETLGGVREWKTYQTRLQLERDGPNTRITATSEWSSDAKVPLYASMFYVAFSAFLVGSAVLNGELAMWWFSAGIFVIALLHAGFVWGPVRKRARTRGPQLDRAIDALERLAGADERAAVVSTTPLTPEAAGITPNAPRLDPLVLDTPTPDAETHRGSASQRLRE